MAIDETSEGTALDATSISSLLTAGDCKNTGNNLLERGDFADACAKYDEGLVALTRVGASEAEAANELRLALHLNASLAQLRRGNLRAAAEHADGAIALDARSEKGYFRRASAYLRLSDHVNQTENLRLAIGDFKKILELNPKNKDAMDQLRILKDRAKKEQKEIAESQRETFKNMFSSGKQLYDVPNDPMYAPPVIRDITYKGEECIAELDNVKFHYNRGETVLDGINLTLRRGHCVGLFGQNASGKTTLARILCGQHSPTAGQIKDLLEGKGKETAQNGTILLSSTASVVAALSAVALGVLARAAQGHDLVDAASWIMRSMLWAHWVALAALSAMIGLVVMAYLNVANSRISRKYSICHVSSDTSDKEDISKRWKIEQVIGEKFPKKMPPEERQRRVIAMLKAAGFQMYNQETGEPIGTPEDYIRDGLAYGKLSGGQQHLMYVLRNLASAPDILVCDEILGGLDAIRQPRILHMVRRMKEELGTCVIYVGVELHQFFIMCDSIGYMSGGVICELGTAEDVLERPKHAATKDFVSHYRGLPGCQVLGGKLAENYAALKGDEALAGDWLPVA